MKIKHFWLVVVSCIAASYTSLASAYLGPGLAAGTMAVILGLLGSLLVAGLAFFWYPIKRMISGEAEHADDAADEDIEVAVAEAEENAQDSRQS